MRALPIKWHCENNEIVAVATIRDELCKIKLVIEHIERDIARVINYVEEQLNNEVANVEVTNKQSTISIVS